MGLIRYETLRFKDEMQIKMSRDMEEAKDGREAALAEIREELSEAKLEYVRLDEKYQQEIENRRTADDMASVLKSDLRQARGKFQVEMQKEKERTREVEKLHMEAAATLDAVRSELST